MPTKAPALDQYGRPLKDAPAAPITGGLFGTAPNPPAPSQAPARVFVFGSNLAGRHGKGAAQEALRKHGAIMGQGVGLQGQSYALPTKDEYLRPLPLSEIGQYVSEFLDVARARRDTVFTVTRVGCGLAGYTDDDIAPMFADAPENCILPSGWRTLQYRRTPPVPVAPHTLHRADAPETSVKAAHEAAKPKPLGDGQHTVLAILAANGGGPMTDDEIKRFYLSEREARGFPMLDAADTLRPRRSDLVRGGLVVALDAAGRSDGGKVCQRWVLTERGREVATGGGATGSEGAGL